MSDPIDKVEVERMLLNELRDIGSLVKEAIEILQSDLGAAGRESGQRDAATPQELRIPAEETAHDAPVGGANPLPDARSRSSAGQRREYFPRLLARKIAERLAQKPGGDVVRIGWIDSIESVIEQELLNG